MKRPASRSALVWARQKSARSLLEEICLILIVEADLKPNTASGVRNWFDRDWLDVAVIQPNTDDIHSSAEGIAGLFSTRTTNVGSGAISRSFLWPVRRELLWGSQLVPRLWLEGTNEGTVPDIPPVALTYFFCRPKFLSTLGVFNPLEQPDTASADA